MPAPPLPYRTLRLAALLGVGLALSPPAGAQTGSGDAAGQSSPAAPAGGAANSSSEPADGTTTQPGRGGTTPAPGNTGRITPTPNTTTKQQPLTPPRAGEFTAHGSVFERYRDDSSRGSVTFNRKSAVTYLNVLPTYNVTDHWAVYARFGGEMLTPGGAGRDYNTNFYQGTNDWRGAAAIDQWGVTFSDPARGLTAAIGRQDTALDGTGLIYDQSWRVGLHTFLDGVSVQQRFGSGLGNTRLYHTGSIQAYAFSEDQYRRTATRNGLYALRVTYRPVHGLVAGVTAAHFQSSAQNQQAGIVSTNNIAVDGRFRLRALLAVAEYGRSDYRERNDTYALGGRYGVTPHDTLVVFSYKIGQHADIGGDTAYVNNNRGTRYSVEHALTRDTILTLYYETDRALYSSDKSTSYQVTLQQIF